MTRQFLNNGLTLKGGPGLHTLDALCASSITGNLCHKYTMYPLGRRSGSPVPYVRHRDNDLGRAQTRNDPNGSQRANNQAIVLTKMKTLMPSSYQHVNMFKSDLTEHG